MRKIKFWIPILLLQLGWGLNTEAQTAPTFNPLVDDIMEVVPPLSALIDSALLHDPYIRFRNLQLFVENCKIKSVRNEWTQYLGVLAEVRYGSYDQFTSSGGSTLATASSSDVRWNASSYFQLPLRTFINRKNQIKQADLEKAQAKSMLDVQRQEVEMKVIRQYNDLVLKQKLMKITSRSKETLEISLQMAEKNFTNGSLPMNEYAMITENYKRAATEFATAEVEFQASYQLLEVLTGMKFQKHENQN